MARSFFGGTDSNSYPEGSFYAASTDALPPFPALEGTVTADICVVGGGFTGLSTALNLAERGYSVVLLEAARIGWGASGRNGGQVGTGQRKDNEDLEDLMGKEDTRELWNIAERSKTEIHDRIKKHDIDCDWRDGILCPVHKPQWLDEYRDHVDFMAQNYAYDKLDFLDAAEMRHMVNSPAYHGGYLDRGAGHLHPLKFCLGLARAAMNAGVRLFEQSEVTSFIEADTVTVNTRNGQVQASFLVLGCNGYLDRLDDRLAAKIMPMNNFILATEPLPDDERENIIRNHHAVADSKFVINYYRFSADNRMLFGGGENYRRGFPADLKSFIRKYMLQIHPQLADKKIDYAWGGTLAITLNRLPHFGRLRQNILFAQGYSGHGVALATYSGRMIADAIEAVDKNTGDAREFDLMASVPTLRFPGGRLLRWPGHVAGMLYYALRDRI